MYDAPFDLLTRVGWILAVVLVVLLGARAATVEYRHAHPERGTPARVLAVVSATATTLAVLTFGTVLVLIVLSTYAAWFHFSL